MSNNHLKSPPTQALADEFVTLVETVAALRGPEGCPWDKEQTQKTLTQYAIEEAFELAEAIESGNQQEIKEELGDFLFQVLLQAQVAKDQNSFDLIAVIQNLKEKLIRRHPHVFSGVKVKNTEEVWQNWERTKSAEKTKPLFSYPINLPALQAANKIGIKTKGYRFDWNHADQVLTKVKEELAEFEGAQNQEEKEEELGDLLFSVAQLARHSNIDPEAALRKANQKFQSRFEKVLQLADEKKNSSTQASVNLMDFFSNLPDQEKELLWSRAKDHFR